MVSGLPPWTIVRPWLHRLGFCATTCASCLLESSGQMHSALGLSIIYVHSRPKSLQLARTRQAVQNHAVWQYSSLHPGQQGRRYFRWTGHATSQDAASALTYHRILRCNSRCPQGPQLTEPRILAPMGGSHRCDRPAASLSTVRKGRPPLRAQTLIPQLQGLATRASSSQPSTMGALSLQVAQHRCHVVAPVSPELNSAPPTSGYVGRLREPLALAGLLSSQKGIARPAITARYRYRQLGPSACSGLCSNL